MIDRVISAPCVWDIINIEEDGVLLWETPPLSVQITKKGTSLVIDFKDGRPAVTLVTEKTALRFLPYLHDAPFAAFTEGVLSLAEDMEAVFRVTLPLNIHLCIGANLLSVHEAPRKMLFDGLDTITGELCTALPCKARLLSASSVGVVQSGADSASRANSADSCAENATSLCVQTEVTLRNRSKALLELDRFVFYPSPVSLFEKGDALLCSPLSIEYSGTGEVKQQTVQTLPPGFSLLRAGAKDGAGSRLFRQGADLLKDITSVRL